MGDTSTSVSAGEKPHSDEDGVAAKKRSLVRPVITATLSISIMSSMLALKAVPWGEILFVPFASVFVYLMSVNVFPPPETAPTPGATKRTFRGIRFMKPYVLFSAFIGLLLPVIQIVASFIGGDQVAGREPIPHLFVLCAQVISENVTFQLTSISLPTKALIPVLYNARRLLPLSIWAAALFGRDLSSYSSSWRFFLRFNAVGNVLFWNYNLWGFLLPVFVPYAMRTHYTAVIKHVD